MKLLGIQDDGETLRWPEGSPYRLRFRVLDSDGVANSLTGRVLSMSIYMGGTALDTAEGVNGTDDDGDYTLFAFDGTVSASRRVSGKWQIGEVFAGPVTTPILEGSVDWAPAAPPVTPEANPDDPSSYDDASWTPATQTLAVVATGPRGAGAEALIDDNAVSTDTTWSSDQIGQQLALVIPFTGEKSGGLNNPRDTMVVGNLAYQPNFGAGSLAIWDVTKDPPELISDTAPTGTLLSVRGIDVIGTWAFVTVQGSQASPGGAFDVWDVSDPTTPVHIVRHASATLLNPFYCRVVGHLLLVGDIRIGGTAGQQNGWITIFDITDPTNPVERGTWLTPIPNKGSRFVVQGPYIYVATQGPTIPSTTDTLDVIDFSDPDNPVRVGTVPLANDSFGADCSINNNIVYVAREGLGGVSIVDATDPTAPVVIGEQDLPAPATPPPGYAPSSTGVACNGGTLYIPDLQANLVHAYDVTNPAAPSFLKTTDEGTDTPARTVAQGTCIYPANRGIGGTAGVGKIKTSVRYFPALEAGAMQVGQLRVDQRIGCGYIQADTGGVFGGPVWFGRGFGAYGDIRVIGNIEGATFNGQALGSAAFVDTGDFATDADINTMKAQVGYPIKRVNTQIALTGTTTETTIDTIVIPANTLLANGRFELDLLLSCNANANIKRLRVRTAAPAGGSVVGSLTVSTSTTVSARFSFGFVNQNSTGSQKTTGLGGGSFGESAAAPSTFALDTTQDITLYLTGLLANTGDNITIESYIAQVYPSS